MPTRNYHFINGAGMSMGDDELWRFNVNDANINWSIPGDDVFREANSGCTTESFAEAISRLISSAKLVSFEESATATRNYADYIRRSVSVKNREPELSFDEAMGFGGL